MAQVRIAAVPHIFEVWKDGLCSGEPGWPPANPAIAHLR